MGKISCISLFFLPFFCLAQVSEQFSDGDFTRNPSWEGTSGNFVVNGAYQLQSVAEESSKSFLFTPSKSFEDAVWECWIRVDYPLSQFNYACFYLTCDRNDDIDDCNAYYVRIGGANDAVSLFLQQGGNKKEIIKGTSKRLDGEQTEVWVKVTRDTAGNFTLYSRLPTESEYVKEGEVNNTAIRQAHYVGLMYSNTAKTGRCYFFDDISVSGKAVEDITAPEWVSLETGESGRLHLTFSEPMDFSQAVFEVDNGVGYPQEQVVSSDGCSVDLIFPVSFERGIIYSLKTEFLADKAGNALVDTERVFGWTEDIEVGDVIFNEVMFEQPEGSCEYIEITNVSGKLLDVSTLVFTTRKADSTLNTGHSLDNFCLLEPGGYLAVAEDAELVRQYHQCPSDSRILSMKWSALNNEGATLVLANQGKDTIYDELTYSVKWHHPLIRNEKGVALERISPYFATQSPDSWHSASSETNYGTPGYRNSQYRDMLEPDSEDYSVWLEPEAFSPDNDGLEDICLIHYRTDEPGYSANVMIFDAMGVEVCRLASNALLSTEGVLVWDGMLSNGTNANIGVYVLYFEMFNTQKGTRKTIKKPIVVSGR